MAEPGRPHRQEHAEPARGSSMFGLWWEIRRRVRPERRRPHRRAARSTCVSFFFRSCFLSVSVCVSVRGRGSPTKRAVRASGAAQGACTRLVRVWQVVGRGFFSVFFVEVNASPWSVAEIGQPHRQERAVPARGSSVFGQWWCLPSRTGSLPETN